MAALDWASSSSAASTSVPRKFDVFLSFRGENIRNNFISFLHKALKDKGINVFVDSDKQWVGETIGSTLRIAIEGSKISIPVFSKGYADSKWCLQELALIVQCHRSNGQLVVPIFYDVDPSHVRHQVGSFKEAFCKHEQKFKPDIVKEWRDALETVGNLIGEVVNETKNQAEVVELVVNRVMDELISNTRLDVCEHPVGIDFLANDLLSIINIGSNEVQFVGICGFGGIGKTTIAKAVYNCILSSVKKHSFLSDVREHATQYLGLVTLQKRLLKDIFNCNTDIADVHKGKSLIEQRLCKEKVFVVLDDVDSREQIEALAGKVTWFGEGSRVIITTRDEDILKQAKVCNIYKPEVFNDRKSLQLFSLHAFGKDNPPKDYMQLSCDVARYSGGLPLTLEVLGSYLSNISDKEEWECTLQRLKEIPEEKVQRRLKISYDNLKDDHKAIFLDVACFFIGWEEDTVISLWKACGYYPKAIMHTLVKRSLLKLEKDYDGELKLRMHDQIRDMGREIVREENPMNPSKRSRLWSYGDILEVLEEHKETDVVKGMMLSNAFLFQRDFCLKSKHLEMMSNLRFLDVSNANFFKVEFPCLPSTLRVFRWMNCPWGIVPTNFYNKRLVYLELSRSTIKEAWNVGPQDENERFKKLEVLNLSHCDGLSKSPEFSWFPYLERLDLRGCKSLEMLDQSIGKLIRLKSLILEGCVSLKELPDGVGLLENLEVLDLTGCESLEMLVSKDQSIGKLIRLKSLILEGCVSLKELPDGVGLLENLEVLYLGDCESLEMLVSKDQSIGKLIRLKSLILHGCMSLKELPDGVGLLENLEVLYLGDCESLEMLVSKDQSIGKLIRLKSLILHGCMSLKELPDGVGLLENLEVLDLGGCESLEMLDSKDQSIGKLIRLKSLYLHDCKSFKELPDGVGLLENLEVLYLADCESLEMLVSKDQSIGKLIRLKSLILEGCVSLKELPDGVGLLENLEVLDLTGCESLEMLVSKDQSIGKLIRLKSLTLKGCKSLKELPDGVGLLENLEKLYLGGCESLEMLVSKDQSIGKLIRLKFLYLHGCKSLKELPDGVGLLENIEVLDLGGCESLEMLVSKDQSIGKLIQLKSLDLRDCKSLKELPNGVGLLENLEGLDFEGCESLEMLDHSIGKLIWPKFLTLQGCKSLKELPDGVGLLENLKVLDLGGCESLEMLVSKDQSIGKLIRLKSLNLRGCKSLKELPDGVGLLQNLEGLDFEGCESLKMLDHSIGKLIWPKFLILRGCKSLKELPDGVGLLEKLELLDASYCNSLVRLPDLSRLKNLRKLMLWGCNNVEEIQGLEGTESLEEFEVSGCYEWTRNRSKILGQGTLLPDRQSVDCNSFTVADGIYSNNMGSLILCIVLRRGRFSFLGDIDLCISASIRRKGKTIRCLHGPNIKGAKFANYGGDIIYIHYFKGFDWFGIPLQDNDAIEVSYINEIGKFGNIKFWKLLYENKEPDQQMPNHYWSTCPFRDYFEWSCAYEASPSGGWSRVYDASLPRNTESENFLSLSSTYWSSNSVPKEKEEQEPRMLNKGALCPMSLPHPGFNPAMWSQPADTSRPTITCSRKWTNISSLSGY